MKRTAFALLLLAFVLPATAQSGFKGFLKGLSDVMSQSAARNNNSTSTRSNLNGSSSSASQAQPAGTKVWREELGYGGFVIVTQYPNNVITRVRYRQCPNCHGTTTCASCSGTRACCFCKGRGGIVTAGYGNYIPCTGCNRTGRCSMCNGTGKCFCTTQGYPGYVIGGTSTITPDGNVNSDNVEYNTGSSSSSSSSSSRSSSSGSGVCPKCGGKGYTPQAYTYAAGSSMAPYHNTGGTTCYICSKATDHYHYRCTECKRR